MLNRHVSALLIFLCCCSPRTAPYENGPVMTKKNIRKTFQPILEFMDAKPGITFGDFGAGSGAITVMMSTMMERSEIYVQDIDTVSLNKRNFEKILSYYSIETGKDLKSKNTYHLVIGDLTKTKLPDNAFDVIYTNATMHVVGEPDSILHDLKRKLKPEGKLFVRDSFKNDHKEGEFCSDKKCGKRLMTIEQFLALMQRNNFELIKRTPDMSGYPVFGFVAKR
jgi:ubiquinone/menaquinone biosynthesis C-methylase UbiE